MLEYCNIWSRFPGKELKDYVLISNQPDLLCAGATDQVGTSNGFGAIVTTYSLHCSSF